MRAPHVPQPDPWWILNALVQAATVVGVLAMMASGGCGHEPKATVRPGPVQPVDPPPGMDRPAPRGDPAEYV